MASLADVEKIVEERIGLDGLNDRLYVTDLRKIVKSERLAVATNTGGIRRRTKLDIIRDIRYARASRDLGFAAIPPTGPAGSPPVARPRRRATGSCCRISTTMVIDGFIRAAFACRRMVQTMLVMMLLATVGMGAHVPGHAADSSSVDHLCKDLAARAIAAAQERRDKECRPSFLATELAPGYNCRGNLWLGDARLEAVFDTGSTRNSIDKGFLKELLKNTSTQRVVTNVEPIVPITCRSVDRNNPIVVNNVAYIRTTFKETPTKTVTMTLGYAVIPESTEDLILGKPTLDALGFVSDRHTRPADGGHPLPNDTSRRGPAGQGLLLEAVGQLRSDWQPPRHFYPPRGSRPWQEVLHWTMVA